MMSETTHHDLCSTCMNVNDCAFLIGSSRPVLNCEEFETEAFVPARTASKNLLPIVELSVSENGDSVRYAGLCIDCEDRNDCMFPKPEGGVWHCEEYR